MISCTRTYSLVSDRSRPRAKSWGGGNGQFCFAFPASFSSFCCFLPKIRGAQALWARPATDVDASEKQAKYE